MLRGLVVMWLAIGSEFPGSNPGNSRNFFFLFFWILVLKTSKNYNGINSIPKNIKVRKKAKKSYFNEMKNENKKTQVGSPSVRLRLVCCTAWVKRWSEAMDFLQTIFKTNIFLSRIFSKVPPSGLSWVNMLKVSFG